MVYLVTKTFNNIICTYNLSDQVSSMELDNNADIGDYDLFLDQINDTNANFDYISSQEHCNQTLVTSEKSSLWPYATLPMLVVSLILGQLIRDVDSIMEFRQF